MRNLALRRQSPMVSRAFAHLIIVVEATRTWAWEHDTWWHVKTRSKVVDDADSNEAFRHFARSTREFTRLFGATIDKSMWGTLWRSWSTTWLVHYWHMKMRQRLRVGQRCGVRSLRFTEVQMESILDAFLLENRATNATRLYPYHTCSWSIRSDLLHISHQFQLNLG